VPICRDVRRIEPVSPIAEPKASGYRALHVIVRREGYPIEVQLRSVLQDAWANQVEEDGRTIGVGLKFGAGEADVHQYYRAVSEAFALMDRGERLPDELVTALNTRYAIIKGILPRDE
jgi:putative GTP pyrophosphokinase